MSTPISTDELKHIKEVLEQKVNESSESEYSSSESDNSSKKIRNKNISLKDYRSKYNQSETRYRYLQLDLSNKSIEISELKEKLSALDKYKLLVKNVNFLFDRLDNAFKILNERLIIKDEKIFKYNTLSSLQSLKELCNKTKDKYEGYINTNILPLFSDDQYILKISLTHHYLDKIKEFDSILVKIIEKQNCTNIYNLFIIISIVISSIFILNIIIFGIYYFM
jgi:hypothetical protein